MPHSALRTPAQGPQPIQAIPDESVPPMLPITPIFLRRTCASWRTISPPAKATASKAAVATCRTIVIPTGMHNGHNNEEASATTSASKPVLNSVPTATARQQIKNDVDASQVLAEQCERAHRRVYELLARNPASQRIREVQQQTRISLGVIGEALKEYRLEELSLSYNGGKDCLVLLILYLTALHTYATGHQPPSQSTSTVDLLPTPSRSQTLTELPQTLRSVYIVTPNPFPQVTSFVERSSSEYHLELDHYVKPMKEAFAAYLHDYPSVRAIFVGTRRTDPHGAKLTHFDPTDGGWPAFMRIHPVIDWHYADIWTFIKELGIEYCELYNMGYTSLGGTTDTHPNPALEIGSSTGPDGKAVKRYRPAFELIEDDAERLGRDR